MPQSWCEPVLDEFLFHFFCHSGEITSRVCYTWWGLKCNNEWKGYSTLLCGKVSSYFFLLGLLKRIDLRVVRTTLSVLISELLSLVNIVVKGAETFLCGKHSISAKLLSEKLTPAPHSSAASFSLHMFFLWPACDPPPKQTSCPPHSTHLIHSFSP